MEKNFFKNCNLNIFFFLVPLLLFLQGCLGVENELGVKSDGSGQLAVKYALEEEFVKELEQAQKNQQKTADATKIPGGLVLTEKDLNEQFRGEGIKTEEAIFEKKENKLHVAYIVTFENLQELLSTKAFQKEDISFYQDKNKNLVFQLETESMRKAFAQQKKQEGFTADFMLTLPGKILDSNADQIEENTLFWHYNIDKLKPEVLKATCEGNGLTFLHKLPTGPKKTKPTGYIYDPTGKPDPFRPFILEMKRNKEESEKALQPLQRYDLSQLKLVGIIWDLHNPRALVEDSAGKGYIITKGSYIGKNEGKVIDILEKEVVITEKATDIFGETETRETRIKLRTGEEERKSK